MTDRGVRISLPGIFNVLKISRWKCRDHKSTIVKHLGGEHGWSSWHTYPHGPLIHSHAEPQDTPTSTCSVLLTAFGKKHFLDSVCKSCFVFLLQNNLHCRNSSICQSWSHHFAWKKEAGKKTIVKELLKTRACINIVMASSWHNA